ncbi:hypothetical protein ABFA07_011250 [Porites harrisoni]
MELVSVALFAFKCGAYLVWKIKKQEILKKLQDSKLLDGKQVRELILTEVELIHLKLDNQARKDLGSSISFYKEGLEILNEVLNNIKRRTTKELFEEEGTEAESIGAQSTLNTKTDFLHAVTNNYERLKLADLNERERSIFEKAKKPFADAAYKAAEAFSNGELRTSERIQSMSIRIMAKILENMEDASIALLSCRSFLKELNSLSDVQDIFRLAVTTTGKKSPFNHEENIRIFAGVCHLNRMVFEVFQLVYKNKVPWDSSPIIAKDGGKVVHGIDPLRDVRVAEALSRLHHQNMKETLLLSVTEFSVVRSFGTEKTKLISPRDITSNNQGQIIVADNGDHIIKVFDQSGECVQSFFALPSYLADEDICGVATDHEDNVFVLIMIDKFHFKVFLFDKDGQLLNKFPLKEGVHSSMVINQRGELLVLGEEKDTKRFAVQKYKTSNGKSDKIFGQDILEEPKDITVTHGGHCLVLNRNGRVTVFDAEGNHRKELDFDYADDALAEAIAFHSESNHVVISNLQPEYRVKVSIFNEHRDCERSIFQGAEQLSREEQRECVPPKIAVTKDGNIAILSGFVGECKVIVV